MKGPYEQSWRNAIAGASVEPSSALWDNIALALDQQRGRNTWVTILLVAATITVAFGFPLTIGNSSFNARPDAFKMYGQQEIRVEDNQQTTDGTDRIIRQNPSPSSRSVSSSAANNPDKENISAGIGFEKTIDETINDQVISVANASIAIYGLKDVKTNPSLKPIDADGYYFIPFYIYHPKVVDRNILASVNFGTGSASASTGLNAFGAMASADAVFEGATSSSIPDNRYENDGTAFFLGAGLELPVGKRWAFIAGIGYLSQNADGYSNIVYDDNGNNQPLGAYDPVIPGTVFLSESYHYSVSNSYVNIPLTLKYPFINKRFKLRAGLGLSSAFMVSHNISSDTYGSASYSPESMGYSTFNLAGLLNMDISYSLNEQYGVAFETGFRKGITAIDEAKDYYPASFTVGLIFFYKIK